MPKDASLADSMTKLDAVELKISSFIFGAFDERLLERSLARFRVLSHDMDIHNLLLNYMVFTCKSFGAPHDEHYDQLI